MNPVDGGDVVIEMEELPPMPLPEEGNYRGRTVKKWPLVLTWVPPVCGAVALGITYLDLKNWAWILVGVSGAITIPVYLRVRNLLKVEELEDQVKTFHKENIRLRKELNSLDKTKNLIRKQVGEAKVAVSELGKILDTKDFEALSDRMGITLKKVQKIALNYTLFNNTFNALSNEVARYEAIRKQIAETVKDLSGEVIKLGDNESDLSSEVDELQENVDEIEENRENLRKQFEEFENFGKEVQGDVGELKLNVDKLETTITMIEETPHKLDEEFKKLNQSVAELWKLVEKGEEVFGKKEGPNSNND